MICSSVVQYPQDVKAAAGEVGQHGEGEAHLETPFFGKSVFKDLFRNEDLLGNFGLWARKLEKRGL